MVADALSYRWFSRHSRRLCLSLWSTVLSQGAWCETKALLVGVSQYPTLSQSEWLRGPGNDVLLFREALMSKGVVPGNITVLSDDKRLNSPQPTRQRIIDALVSLGRRAKQGDVFVLYLAGHGTRLPALPPDHRSEYHPEPDGLDEVFLPIDAVRQESDVWVAERGIRDNEIGALLAVWQRKGAFVWAIFDTCSAGDMAKSPSGATSEQKVRRFPKPLTVLQPAVVYKALPVALRQRLRPQSGNAIYFYATQPHQASPEMLLPTPLLWPRRLDGGSSQPRVFGVFTHALVTSMGAGAFTFKDLAERVMRKYAQRALETPMFEGELNRSLQIIRNGCLNLPTTSPLCLGQGNVRKGGEP
jgi:Caspase domain